VVDKSTKGVMVGKPERKCGIKASDTREITFVDVVVPKENVLGQIKDGFRMAVSILNSGRIGVSFRRSASPAPHWRKRSNTLKCASSSTSRLPLPGDPVQAGRDGGHASMRLV